MSAPTAPPGGLPPGDAAARQRARRYAVPARMIRRATAHRPAGDRRAACAAAGVEVAVDLTALASRYGTAVAGAVEADLHGFAPDLLRRHLPRALGGRSALAPMRVLPARHGTGPLIGADAPRPPAWVETVHVDPAA